jgi:hypothetical protein
MRTNLNTMVFNGMWPMVDPWRSKIMELPLILFTNNLPGTGGSMRGCLPDIRLTSVNTHDTLNSMARIVFSVPSFPWDGVTTPLY